jgi:hypothetical protein
MFAPLIIIKILSISRKLRINILTQFEKLKKVNFRQTLREYFKNNNNHLWNILCRIILQLNLHVELFKVVAHGDDKGNNYVDRLAKEIHFDENAYINFKNDASLMKILPKWNGILIENRLRSFIKMICNFKGMEKFLNLYRNSKYRRLEVDWTSTFQCLNSDIQKNETSVSSSKVKAQKVHLLIEEIPTLEQMKKSFFKLYDEWKCPICGLENETFYHVWSCDEHKATLKAIRDDTFNNLINWILEYNEDISIINDLYVLNIWDITYDSYHFTFIDLIKGIIPSTLSQCINSWTNKNNTSTILV